MAVKKQKKRVFKTLSGRTIVAIILSCLLLSAITQAITIYNYTMDLLAERIRAALSITFHARSSVVNEVSNSVEFAQRVMDTYYNLPKEVQSQSGKPWYRAYFQDVLFDYPGETQTLNGLLGVFMNSEYVSDVYLGMYDRKNCALVYIVDPEEENRFYPGEWEAVDREEVEKFLNWEQHPDEPLYDLSNTKLYGWLCTAGVPIVDAEGNTVCFVLADIKIKGIMDNVLQFAFSLLGFFLLATALIVWILYHHMKKDVIDPINEIADAASAYARDKLNGVKETDRFSKLDIHQSRELENLTRTMRNMEHSLTEYEENLTAITAEKQRIGTELDMAMKIQTSILPSTFPAFPDRNDFDIYATMHAAREVGGDFYDFFLIDDDHLGLVIADVSGKGIPAALFMMISKVIVQSCAMLGRSPADILAKTNTAICSSNKTEFFVTMWVGIVELSTGKVTASNAGHEYPVLYRNGERFELIQDKHSLFVGGMEDVTYEEYSFEMKKGDKLFVYTDGIPEATNSKGEFFGMDRMVGALNENPASGPRETIERIKENVDKFVGSAEQFDDITMMCFEYKG